MEPRHLRYFVAVADGGIDVGFLRPPVANAALASVVLLREPLIAGLPQGHRLAVRECIHLVELAAEPAVMYTPGRSSLYGQVLSACAAAGFVPRVVHQAMHIMTLVGLVRSGIGVALLPRSTEAVRMEGIR